MPFVLSFIANIARKRPKLNRDKTIRDNVHRLQLHPAYSYEDFIRTHHISSDGRTEYRAGYLPKLIENIEQQPRSKRLPHVLILDEMNRTNLSRMLGKCFSLLEDRNQTIELPAHNGDGSAMKLSIPDDLFVIGTMNLIDQSIEQIDFALRRRFLWLLCPFDTEALFNAAETNWGNLKSGLDWKRIEPDFRKLAATADPRQPVARRTIRDWAHLFARFSRVLAQFPRRPADTQTELPLE